MDKARSDEGRAVQTGSGAACVCFAVSREIFDRLSSPVPVSAMTRLRALLDSLVIDLGYSFPSHAKQMLPLRPSSDLTACRKEPASNRQGGGPATHGQKGVHDDTRRETCRHLLREAVLSSRFLSQVGKHLEKCSLVFSRSSSSSLHSGTHLLWAWIVLQSILAQREPNEKATCCLRTGVAEAGAPRGEFSEENRRAPLAAADEHEERGHSSAKVDVGRALDGELCRVHTETALFLRDREVCS